MSPGEETIRTMRAIAAERPTGELTREERERRERISTRFGWGLLGFDVFIVGASVTADLLALRPVTVSLTLASVAILLAFGGGALIQGTRLDKILAAWRKNGNGTAA